ncbi:sigma-54 interaction domain-containing protein [Desnuesiella massiliensis]|uniref:sigma-54 interaction domain-containing protein n=1 Tax=Desnuesiella massiliensis TaxID=1650662 RepID=UPI0006E3E365|nr:sigma 54-interacting transcriptional regulator [Desnuesiella massiliensis]
MEGKYYLKALDSIVSMLKIAVLAVDKELKIVIFNGEAEKILNIDKEQVIGKSVLDIIENSDLPNVINHGKVKKDEIIHIKGKSIMTHRIPIKDNEDIIGAMALFQDISENIRLSQELDQEKKHTSELSNILESIYEGVITVDKKGLVTYISKPYANFLGVDEEKSVGKHVTEVIENTRMHIVAETGLEEICDIQKVKDGYMIASRYPIKEQGKVVGAVGKVIFRNLGEFDILYKKINNMEKTLELYKGEIKHINKAKYCFDSILGSSTKIKETKKYAMKAASTDSNVLLMGESGTGKELFAHAIHNNSKRRKAPFIKVNCAAIPGNLLESELFGYEEGAFTGAKKGGKLGKFELADGGTIFLDEIGDMPYYMQAKILRVIQEREIERLGGSNCRNINVRVIAATNKDLVDMVAKGKFRQDLYYRLNVLNINIPPLRERREDIKELSFHFLEKYSINYGKYIDDISQEALNCLYNYEWRGNIRELSNIIERAVNVAEFGGEIAVNHLPHNISEKELIINNKSLQQILEEAEKKAILESLKISKGNRSKAARLLRISRTTFYEKLEKFDLLKNEVEK